MKYVILIYSNPDPWGHPTVHYTAEGKAMPQEWLEQADRDFDALLRELNESGEFVIAEALAAPAAATVYTWGQQGPLATDGPYAEAKEQLAGFFLLDCATPERAREIAERFASPGDTIELRPAMWDTGSDT